MITTFEDPNIEFRNQNDLLVDVFYKGDPYSGILKDRLETTKYRDGKANGQSTEHYSCGQLKISELYEDGVLVSGVSYHENGQKKAEMSNGSYSKWTDAGVLIQKDKAYYFENGALRILKGSENDSFTSKYFTPDGDLIYTQRKDIWEDNQYKRIVDYNHELMHKWYFELLHPVDTCESEKQRIHNIWLWLWEVFDQDQQQYFQVVNTLLTHPDEPVLKMITDIIAFHKFQPYIQVENDNNAIAYGLLKESTKHINQINPNRQTKPIE